jgi:hypothetical protein
MGAEQSGRGSRGAAEAEEQSKDSVAIDLVAKAERKFKTLFISMKDAYGDEDGAEMFRRVVLSPALYQSDNRRLIQTLVTYTCM